MWRVVEGKEMGVWDSGQTVPLVKYLFFTSRSNRELIPWPGLATHHSYPAQDSDERRLRAIERWLSFRMTDATSSGQLAVL